MEITSRPTIETEVISDTRAVFKIAPLEPGFGYTVGNALRRTLLSSIPGAAVTSIKIDGVSHEFQVVEGVKEDVVEIVQNIKGLVVASIVDEPQTVHISASKAGAITAKDIKVPSGIEVFNPDHHICTLAKGTFNMELVIERGRGYVPADINKRAHGKMEVGRIAVDSIYTPVLNVKYNVEASRVGEHTNFNNLTIDVTTKESISPVDALASAGKTLTELFGLVHHLNTAAEGLSLPVDSNVLFGAGTPSVDDLSNDSVAGIELSSEANTKSLSEIGITGSAVKLLNDNNINTVADLLEYSQAELLKLDKIGKAKVEQIVEALAKEGYTLS